MEIINDFNLFRTQLINKLGQELPGESSHNKLMSYIRPTATEIKKSSDYRESAVLALIYFINSEPYLVFILRQSYQGVHSAQVSFPGGKKESSDSTLIETALREAEEEISVIAKDIEILGSLTEIYVPPSNFLISPFIGIVNNRPEFIKDTREVAEIIEVKLSLLLDEDSFVTTTVDIPDGNQMKVPAFLVNKHIVWGATAMMVQEIKDILSER